MESLMSWTNVFFESLKSFGEQIMGALPGIIGAILLIILGWLIAKLIARLTTKLLKAVKFDKMIDKLNATGMLKNLKINVNPSVIVGKFIFWVIFLLFIVTATETLGWTVVASEITNLIRFIPNLFIGIIIFIIGLYIANFIRTLISAFFSSLGLTSGKIISEITFYIIMIIITLTALKQTGINTRFIDNNITIIIGILVGAFALSFALSSKDILQNILASFYSKSNFCVGQQIKIDGISGKIIKIDSIHLVIENGTQKFVFPVSKLLTEKVEIINEPQIKHDK
jgi:hypothetical protein